MSRVRYVPDEPAAGSGADTGAAAQELMAQIRARRGGLLLNLDRLLLHSPPFARGWNAHLGAVRRELLLPPKLRELAICAVAVLNQVDYEWEQHSPEWLRAGATAEQLAVLRATPMELEASNVFDSVEKAVLQLTLEMTRHVRVSEPTFERVRNALSRDERVVVELVGVVASYNMVSRFLVALEIDPEKSRG
jgi:alkylhydroperoxidase family enzyme